MLEVRRSVKPLASSEGNSRLDEGSRAATEQRVSTHLLTDAAAERHPRRLRKAGNFYYRFGVDSEAREPFSKLHDLSAMSLVPSLAFSVPGRLFTLEASSLRHVNAQQVPTPILISDAPWIRRKNQ